MSLGAKFADGRGPNGVRFGPGEYELLEGIVHLRFAQGADMVLSSPARLEVTDSQHARLAFGSLNLYLRKYSLPALGDSARSGQKP